MIRFFTLGVLLAFFCTTCFGQKFLLFQKNKRRKAIYKTGATITFWLRGDKTKITDQIIGFEDSVIVFEDYTVPVRQISHLYADDQIRSWYIFRYKTLVLPIAGTGYLLADLINTGKPDQETLIISGSLIAGGFLAKWIIGNKIRIKGKRKLYIIE